MTVRFLLDSNVLSEPVRAAPNLVMVRRIEAHDGEIATAAVVWHELLFGCFRLPPSRKRTALEAYLYESLRPRVAVLPYDEAAAAWHARERARLAAIGRSAPFEDGQIAATAAVNGLTLVTGNRAHFQNFDDLEIEDWRE